MCVDVRPSEPLLTVVFLHRDAAAQPILLGLVVGALGRRHAATIDAIASDLPIDAVVLHLKTVPRSGSAHPSARPG